jgi:two-component system CheB/CheR fusion protein
VHQATALPEERKAIRLKRGAKDRRITELEQELAQTREDMRRITEEQEATNEELQTASEEILSSNEELQSINEELETGKEELESTNEELTTVNEELQNSNEQLTHARDYAESIIRTVQVPLLILDKDLRIKTANRSFNQMFQVPEEETMGKLIYDLGNGQWNIPALQKLLNEILPKNNLFDNYEIEHTFPSIGHRIMLLNARKFYKDKDGENILLAIEDITDRKDVEEQKDLFIGIASHELKTPITTMKGYAQILEKRLGQQGDSKNTYLVQNINKQTDRLTNLINDLLNTSKIQAGKLVLEKKKFDLNKIVTKAVIDFQYATETHKIIKEGKIEEGLNGDQSRIEQVLANLITNAIKYSPKADKIIVRIGTDKKNAIVSVQDFGFGIAKKDQAYVFERFYRTDNREKTDVAGFGLGLYISAEIIKSHGGKIWLESMKDKGTIFYFTLPL